MKIGLAGDWHGDGLTAERDLVGFRIRDPELKYVYQLGDFGVWPGEKGKQYLTRVQQVAAHQGLHVFVTEGNHEDYDQINALEVAEDGLKWTSPNLALIPRGFRWTLGGRSFVSLGGAPSIDFQHRVEGVSWWKDEMITEADVQRVADGGYADVMLTHDAPDGGTNAVQRIIDDPEALMNWSNAGLAYAKQGRLLMNMAYHAVMPRFFAHGHFHVADFTDDGKHAFLSLSCNGMARHRAILDLEDYGIDIGW